MLKINENQAFGLTIAFCLKQAHLNCKSEAERDRWIRAIGKAAFTINETPDFIEWMPEENHLLYWSGDSNEIYTANGVCQCKAFNENKPCYHRAMYRIVRLYFSLVGELKSDKKGQFKFSDAVYFDREMTITDKISHLRDCLEMGEKEAELRINFLSFLNSSAVTARKPKIGKAADIPYLKMSGKKKPLRVGRYSF